MKALNSDLKREIKRSWSRFISIMMIIALGVGFFVGVKATSPSMKKTADSYFNESQLMDVRLLSTFGFDNSDVEAIKELSGIEKIMPSYSVDVILKDGDKSSVVKMYALPEEDSQYDELNQPRLIEGRMPKASNECLAEIPINSTVDYKIGDKVKVSLELEDTSLEDVLKQDTFTIVGIVESSMFITYDRGISSIGDGSISNFFMIPAENFLYSRYTELYIKTASKADVVSTFNSVYKDGITKITKSFDDLSFERYAIFKENLSVEISEAEKELEKEKVDAQTQLNEAKNKLDQALQQLANAKLELAKGKEEYNIGVKEYYTKTTEGYKQLQAGWNEYNKNTELVNSQIVEVNNGLIQLDQAKIDYRNGVNEYNTGVAEVNENKQKIEAGKSDLETLKQTRDYLQEYISAQENIGTSESELASSRAQLADLNKQISDGEQQISEGELQIAAAQKELAAAKIELDAAKKKIEETEVQLEDAQNQIIDAKSQLNEAKQVLDENQALYDNETTAGKKNLDQAYTDITKGEQDIKKEREIEEGQSTYDASVIDADLQLKDGEERILSAKNLISDVQPGKWYVFTREDNPGYSGFEDDANRIDAIASIFPVFFLLVAALVCLTTMTRMVEEQRVQIGTLKALGYGAKSIAGKFFIYASLASLIGSIIGIILGITILPKVIFSAYKAMYTLPPLQTKVPILAIIAAIIAALICTSTVALFSCYRELKLHPASLMRPKAPKPGKRIFMEKIGFLWNHMQFTSKVTARNLFRYKGRFFMTVLGVAGCTALILSGLGLKDAISGIVPRQFNDIANYDSIITLKQSEPIDEQADIINMLDKEEQVDKYIMAKQANIKAFTANSKTKVESYLMIPESSDKLKDFVKLQSRDGSNKYTLNNEGVIITEKLASMLSLKVGDHIQFKYNDKDYTALISGITENYVFHYIYCSPDYFKKLTNENVTFNTILTQLKNISSKEERNLSSTWLLNDKIIAVNFITSIVNDFNDTIKSLNVVVLVMILSAGALAFVVLYNLTNINIAERVREIATIKVLGFYNKEVSNYVYRENIVLSVIGIIVGLIIGFFLTKFMVKTIEMDIVMFGREIKLFSFLIAAALTILFSVFVNWMMSFRMKKISMVESLKSIE